MFANSPYEFLMGRTPAEAEPFGASSEEDVALLAAMLENTAQDRARLGIGVTAATAAFLLPIFEESAPAEVAGGRVAPPAGAGAGEGATPDVAGAVGEGEVAAPITGGAGEKPATAEGVPTEEPTTSQTTADAALALAAQAEEGEGCGDWHKMTHYDGVRLPVSLASSNVLVEGFGATDEAEGGNAPAKVCKNSKASGGDTSAEAADSAVMAGSGGIARA